MVLETPVGCCDDVKNNQTVFVTTDFAKLKKEWAEAELGPITDDDLRNYCGCPGKIKEIEDDDETVMLEWLTKDTQWIPIAACVNEVDPSKKKAAPFQVCEMVNEPQPLNYVTSIEAVKTNQTVYVTTDFKKLKKEWAAAELGPISDEDLKNYCACPGKIKEVEDDDDTVMLEWLTMDTQWIPVLACVLDLEEKLRKDAPFQVCEMVNEAQPLEYYTLEEVKVNDQVWVTTDFKKLRKEWAVAELGSITDADLETYCACPGKIKEIEEDDDTVMLEWLTMDTQWIPIAACVKEIEEKLRRDAPFQVCEIVNEKAEEAGKGGAESKADAPTHELIESDLPVVEV